MSIGFKNVIHGGIIKIYGVHNTSKVKFNGNSVWIEILFAFFCNVLYVSLSMSRGPYGGLGIELIMLFF